MMPWAGRVFPVDRAHRHRLVGARPDRARLDPARLDPAVDVSLSRLHEASRDLYGALRDHLPSGRGHSAEAVSIISALARAMGISHVICGGVSACPTATRTNTIGLKSMVRCCTADAAARSSWSAPRTSRRPRASPSAPRRRAREGASRRDQAVRLPVAARPQAYLRRNPLCVHCQRRGLLVPAQHVDHVKPHRATASCSGIERTTGRRSARRAATANRLGNRPATGQADG